MSDVYLIIIKGTKLGGENENEKGSKWRLLNEQCTRKTCGPKEPHKLSRKQGTWDVAFNSSQQILTHPSN